MFSDVWNENTALFERLMEIHSNPPILYYGLIVNFVDGIRRKKQKHIKNKGWKTSLQMELQTC